MSEIVAEEVGVRLTRIERDGRTTSGRSGAALYSLTSLRPGAPRAFGDLNTALKAFAAEVEASRRDPVVRRVIDDAARGPDEPRSWI